MPVSAPGELAEAREELRAVARDLLAKTPDPSWPAMAASGWTGLEVPEALGGAGVTFAETAVICEELGRAGSRASYLGAVLGTGALLALSPSPARDDLLRATAAGEAMPVAVLPGHADFVPDAAEATHLLLVSATPATSATPTISATSATPATPGPMVDNSKKPPAVLITGAGDRGVSVEARPVVDETRRLARVTWDPAAVPGDTAWEFAGDPGAALAALLDRAAVAVACDSLGIAEAMLDKTVAYVKIREQFGRPVGSFQAVQHACAGLLVAIRASRELVTAAVDAIAAGDPDAGVAASMAKSHACAAAVEVAGKAMQLHGGIGYTWESGIHAYLKRAALNRELFGSLAEHRRRLAARLSVVAGE